MCKRVKLEACSEAAVEGAKATTWSHTLTHFHTYICTCACKWEEKAAEPNALTSDSNQCYNNSNNGSSYNKNILRTVQAVLAAHLQHTGNYMHRSWNNDRLCPAHHQYLPTLLLEGGVTRIESTQFLGKQWTAIQKERQKTSFRRKKETEWNPLEMQCRERLDGQHAKCFNCEKCVYQWELRPMSFNVVRLCCGSLTWQWRRNKWKFIAFFHSPL